MSSSHPDEKPGFHFGPKRRGVARRSQLDRNAASDAPDNVTERAERRCQAAQQAIEHRDALHAVSPEHCCPNSVRSHSSELPGSLAPPPRAHRRRRTPPESRSRCHYAKEQRTYFASDLGIDDRKQGGPCTLRPFAPHGNYHPTSRPEHAPHFAKCLLRVGAGPASPLRWLFHADPLNIRVRQTAGDHHGN